MPKTIDNDVYPIKQSLGAWTAAEQGARFFANVVGEQSANPRMLIVHEVMGRNCGYLTAATAAAYRKLLDGKKFLPELGLARENYEVLHPRARVRRQGRGQAPPRRDGQT